MLRVASKSISFPLPENEQERLLEILEYDFKDQGAKASLDKLCHEARRLFNVPIALITLIGHDNQTFLAKCGVDAGGSSRKDSFCTFAILGDEVMVVADATLDARFSENPYVTGEMHVRFYAGAPLTLRPRVRIGTLCIIDTKPRQLSEADATRLQMLAGLATNEIRGRRLRIDLQRQQNRLATIGVAAPINIA